MKYRAGDKVRIKTWKALKKEFGINKPVTSGPYARGRSINCAGGFPDHKEESVAQLKSNREVTIKRISQRYYYHMEEIGCCWFDDCIECLVERPVPIESIDNRFNILDL